MKGIVFNQLQAFVEEGHGILAWDRAIMETKFESEGVYVATKSYSDEELLALVGYFSQQLDVPVPDLVRAFGEYVFSKLMQMAPEKAKNATNLKDFLLMVEDIIHVEVNKLYRDANLPEFEYVDESEKLTMIYRSPRKLCFFSEGLIFGAAKHFSQKVSVTQPKCMHEGCDYCELEVTFL